MNPNFAPRSAERPGTAVVAAPATPALPVSRGSPAGCDPGGPATGAGRPGSALPHLTSAGAARKGRSA